jgi:hypothetical protein
VGIGDDELVAVTHRPEDVKEARAEERIKPFEHASRTLAPGAGVLRVTFYR